MVAILIGIGIIAASSIFVYSLAVAAGMVDPDHE